MGLVGAFMRQRKRREQQRVLEQARAQSEKDRLAELTRAGVASGIVSLAAAEYVAHRADHNHDTGAYIMGGLGAVTTTSTTSTAAYPPSWLLTGDTIIPGGYSTVHIPRVYMPATVVTEPVPISPPMIVSWNDPSRHSTIFQWNDGVRGGRIEIEGHEYRGFTHPQLMEMLYAQGYPRPGGTPQAEGAQQEGVIEIRDDTGPPGLDY